MIDDPYVREIILEALSCYRESLNEEYQTLEGPDAADFLAQEHLTRVVMDQIQSGNIFIRVILDAELFCPKCNGKHIDRDEWQSRPHHKHLCEHCGHVWRLEKYYRGIMGKPPDVV